MKTRGLNGARFEKTKPIFERLNERKYLYERVLWGISWFWAV